jgi:transcriptional regulator with XRE-family HTH domain
MERMNLLYQMDGLLRECETCDTRKVKHYNPEKACGGCSTYKKLRAIGDKLGEGNKLKAIKMSIEQYNHYKAKGYTDSKISEKLGCTPNTISNWKKKHVKGSNKLNTEVKTQSETKDIQEDFKAENGRLKRELVVREKAIKDLQEEVASLSGENAKNINSVMELEADYNQQRSFVINLDQELENAREQLRQARKESVKYGKENEHLWGLLKIKMEG